MWDEPTPKTEGRAKLMAADKAVQTGPADEAPFIGEDDSTPGEYPDRKNEDEKTAEKIAEATDWAARQDAKREKEAANIEIGLWSRVLDDQTNTDGGEDG